MSLSAAQRWSSWAELSTDKESRSQTGCRVLWTDWSSLASQPDEMCVYILHWFSLCFPTKICNRKSAEYILTLFIENNSIWLFLRLKSLWTSLNTVIAPSRSPVAPWHTTQHKKIKYGLGANIEVKRNVHKALFNLYCYHLRLNRRSSTGTSETRSSVAQRLCRLLCSSVRSCCTNLKCSTIRNYDAD